MSENKTIKTNYKTILDILNVTETISKDLMYGPEEVRDQLLAAYAGLATAMDQFIQAAYVAKTPDQKKAIENVLADQIRETSKFAADDSDNIIKFPFTNKPQA